MNTSILSTTITTTTTLLEQDKKNVEKEKEEENKIDTSTNVDTISNLNTSTLPQQHLQQQQQQQQQQQPYPYGYMYQHPYIYPPPPPNTHTHPGYLVPFPSISTSGNNNNNEKDAIVSTTQSNIVPGANSGNVGIQTVPPHGYYPPPYYPYWHPNMLPPNSVQSNEKKQLSETLSEGNEGNSGTDSTQKSDVELSMKEGTASTMQIPNPYPVPPPGYYFPTPMMYWQAPPKQETSNSATSGTSTAPNSDSAASTTTSAPTTNVPTNPSSIYPGHPIPPYGYPIPYMYPPPYPYGPIASVSQPQAAPTMVASTSGATQTGVDTSPKQERIEINKEEASSTIVSTSADTLNESSSPNTAAVSNQSFQNVSTSSVAQDPVASSVSITSVSKSPPKHESQDPSSPKSMMPILIQQHTLATGKPKIEMPKDDRIKDQEQQYGTLSSDGSVLKQNNVRVLQNASSPSAAGTKSPPLYKSKLCLYYLNSSGNVGCMS
jgi:hypothetical protein